MSFFEDHLASAGRRLDTAGEAARDRIGQWWAADGAGSRTASQRIADWWRDATPTARRTTVITSVGATVILVTLVARSLLTTPPPPPPSAEAQRAYADVQNAVAEGMRARNRAAAMGTVVPRPGAAQQGQSIRRTQPPPGLPPH